MKKFLLILVALIATTTVWATDFITDVMVIGGSKSEVNSLKTTYTSQGWTVVDKDLNDGCGSGSDYIYLLYRKGSDNGQNMNNLPFISDFLINDASGTAPDSLVYGSTYYLVPFDGGSNFKNKKGDLNSNAGGKSIHLYYSRKNYSDYRVVKDISFNDTQSGGVCTNSTNTGYDLNAGAGGDYIYMHADKSQGWTTTTNTAGTQCVIKGFEGPKAAITSIDIPTSIDGADVTGFSGFNFSGFTILETMAFFDNTIIDSAPVLQGCSSFKHLNIKDSLNTINTIYQDKTPTSMVHIPEYSFAGTAIENLTLTSVTSIGNNAFKECGSLKDVYVSSTLNTIGKQVFYNCSSMAHLWFDGTEAQWNAVSKDNQWRTGAANFTEHWRCTVTFDANGHGTAPAAQTVWCKYDKATEPTAPTAPLSTFQGWYTDAACTNQWNFNTVVTGDMTLYAKWDSQYTFNSSTGVLTLNYGEFNMDNKWGDDVPKTEVTSVIATSQVSFTGDCSWMFQDFQNCTSMDLNSVNTSNVTNMREMFRDCHSLITLNISNWDTGNVSNMSGMFNGCSIKRDPLNISNWNTSNVTNMGGMFMGCTIQDHPLDLSGWDTSNVTSMDHMFYYFKNTYPLDLSGFNTSNVNNMRSMFFRCDRTPSLNLAGWDTRKVRFMDVMFSVCDSLTTIYVTTSWTLESVGFDQVEDSYLFKESTKLVGGMGTTFDVNHVDAEYARIDHGTDEPGYLTGVFTLILPGDVAATPNPVCTLRDTAFYAAGTTVTLTYNGNVPEGKVVIYSVNGTTIVGNTFEMPLDDVTITATVTDPPRYTFNSTTGQLTLLWGEFNKDNKWGSEVSPSAVKSVTATSEVSFTGDCTELFYGFYNCESMELGNVNTDSVTSMNKMFYWCSNLTSLDLSGWNTGNVTNMSAMFENCSALTLLDVSELNTGNVTDMSSMFCNCSGLTTLDLSGWNTGKVTNMWYMFFQCSGLTNLNLSGWNTGNVTHMNNMFYDCSGLTTLDLSGWNTGKVTDMNRMFYKCSVMTSLDISGWNTGNVTNMDRMFSDCSSLTTIYASTEWSTESVEDSGLMFFYCKSLVGGMGTTYDASHLNAEYARIDGGPDCPGYFTAAPQGVPGDVNGDGAVTSADVTCVYNYLLNGDETFIDTCDVNGDGAVTSADVTVIYNILLGNKKK